jgi:hypothetical protein
MLNLAISFASLVKNNNGIFKSAKQASFSLMHCNNCSEFSATGSVYKNSYTLVYTCDELGIFKVEKLTKNKNAVVWTRLAIVDAEISATNKVIKNSAYVAYISKLNKLTKLLINLEISEKHITDKFLINFTQSANQSDFVNSSIATISYKLLEKRIAQKTKINGAIELHRASY